MGGNAGPRGAGGRGDFRKNGDEAGGQPASVTRELLGFCMQLNRPAFERLARWGFGWATCHFCGTFEAGSCVNWPLDGTLRAASLGQKRFPAAVVPSPGNAAPWAVGRRPALPPPGSI